MIDLSVIAKYNPCPDAVAYLKTQPDWQTAWVNCNRVDWMLWLLGKVGVDNNRLRKLVGFAASEARRVSNLWPADGRAACERAVFCAEGFARGVVLDSNEAADDAYAAYAAYAADAARSAAHAAAAAAYAAYAAHAAAAAAAYAAYDAAAAAYAAYDADDADDAAAAAYDAAAYDAAAADRVRLVFPACPVEVVP